MTEIAPTLHAPAGLRLAADHPRHDHLEDAEARWATLRRELPAAPDDDALGHAWRQLLARWVGGDLPATADDGADTAEVRLRRVLDGDHPTLVWEYRSDLWERATVERWAGWLEALLDDPEAGAETLLDDAQRRDLETWSRPPAVPSSDASAWERFRARAAERPEAPALWHEGRTRTYGELEGLALRAASALRRRGVGVESRVAVFQHRTPELVASLLGIWGAGGGYVPLDPGYPRERLEQTLEDCDAAWVLVDDDTASRLPETYRDRALSVAELLRENPEPPASREADGDIDPGPRALSHVIYTSGSTGRPKGVTLDRGNVAALLDWAEETFASELTGGLLAATSVCFDLSVFELFAPLTTGGRVVLADNALALATLADDAGVTWVNTVPSAMAELLAAGSVPASVKTVSLAGEALPGSLTRGLYEAGIERVWNLYGPSEDTTYSTGAVIAPDEIAPPIGAPVAGSRAHVLDRDGDPALPGAVGELALGGLGVTRGYLGRPAATAERYVPDPFADEPGGRMYLTGDLTRWGADGELRFLGRRDHQVKVRGFRIELGEIETVLDGHPSVGRTVVTAHGEVGEDRRLVAYVTPADGGSVESLELEDLRAWVGSHLPGYMVPSSWVLLPEMPLTPNGKVDRKALPEPARDDSRPGAAAGQAPASPLEEMLAGIWCEALGVGSVGVDERFFEDLGGHSLLATRVLSRVREHLGVELSLGTLFDLPTVRELAQRVDELRRGDAPALPTVEPLAPGERLEDQPLSFAQEQLWLFEQAHPDTAVYHVAETWTWTEAAPSAEALCQGWRALHDRHELLRTTLHEGDDGPVQRLHEEAVSDWTTVDLGSLADDDRAAEARRLGREHARRPFDLSRLPMARAARVLTDAAAPAVLWVSLPHLVTDGWSQQVLRRDLAASAGAFEAGTPAALPTLPVSPAAHARWSRAHGAPTDEAVEAWRAALAEVPPVLELATDRPRPTEPGFTGHRLEVHWPRALRADLEALGRGSGATLYMTLLAGFAALLSRETGGAVIPVGSPVAEREHPEVSDLVGYFLRVLVQAPDLSGDPTARELLARVRGTALAAFERPRVPFQTLAEHLAPRGGANPLFQVFFQLETTAPLTPAEGVPSSALPRVEDRPTDTAKFDLELSLRDDVDLIGGYLELDRALFDRVTGRRLLARYRRLMEAMAAAPDLPLSRLWERAALTPAERHQVALEWNDTAAPEAPSFLTVILDQARRNPDAVAVVDGDRCLTYGAFDVLSNRVARRLLERGVGLDDRVGLLLPRSAEALAAVLGVLRAGAAYVPIDPEYPEARRAHMVEAAGIAALITDPRSLDTAPPTPAPVLLLNELVTPKTGDAGDGTSLALDAGPESLAYIIFTSGSTGLPKGVALTRRSLSSMVEWQSEVSTPTPERTLQFASLSFDVSCQEILSTWASGGTLVTVSEDTRRDLAALLDHLTLHAVERLFLPFVAAQALAHEAVGGTGDARPPLANLITAGEQLRMTPELRTWVDDMGAALHNHYGPSETHVVTAWVTRDPQGAPLLPTVGHAVTGTRVEVVDADGRLTPLGVPGELMLGGRVLARGYLGRPAATAERFVPDPRSPEDAPGARVYLTGDRARARTDGAFDFLGRLDQQVKIRGHRVEPGEVEAVLEGMDGVREALVVTHEDASGHLRLVAYVVPAGDDPVAGEAAAEIAADLRRRLGEALPAYLVPSAVVPLDAMPRTPSGKRDRRSLPEPDLSAGDDMGDSRPSTPTETLLAQMWRDLLGGGPVGPDDDFFDRGGHSLSAARLLTRLRRAFGVDMALRTVFEAPTLGALGRAVDAALRSGGVEESPVPALSDVERSRPLPLSYSQERLFFLQELNPGNPFYNLPSAHRLRGDLAVPALVQALGEIGRRHQVLRSRFELSGERPTQRVTGEAPRTRAVDLTGLVAADRDREAETLIHDDARTPFDLRAEPAARWALVHRGEDDRHLLVNAHHIAADGWSMGLLGHETEALYDAFTGGRPSPLAEPSIQVADFAVWQRRHAAQAEVAADLDYWRGEMAGAPAQIELPTDHPRPADPRYRGDTLFLRLTGDDAEALRRAARNADVTLYMLVTAAFQGLLARWASQPDVVVGMPVAGRHREEVEGLVGCFLNLLPLRAAWPPERTLADGLARTRETVLGAFAHQRAPFERLVEALRPQRDPSRHPLFQVLVQQLDDTAPPLDLEAVRTERSEHDYGSARFDMEVTWTDEDGTLEAWIEYDRDLWDRPTLERWARWYGRLLAAFAETPDVALGRVPLLGDAERRQVLEDWALPAPVPSPSTSPWERFRARAAEEPEAPALWHDGRTLSYGELEGLALRLASALRRRGVGVESRVAVFQRRTPELVASLLGIWGAAGGYVPLDPDYPRERVVQTLEDCDASWVLVDDDTADRLPGAFRARALTVSELAEEAAGEETFPGAVFPGAGGLPRALSHVIYTSGSTGRPKGVTLDRGNTTALLDWAADAFAEELKGGLAAVTSVSFDLSVFELFAPLTTGGRVVLVDNALALSERSSPVEDAGITWINSVPSAVAELLAAGAITPAIRVVTMAGETLPGSLARGLYAAGVERVWNLYGPSEDTTYSTGTVVERDVLVPPIGVPLAGSRAYVVDPSGALALPGAVGEVVLGGPSVTRGYLGRPATTAERFVPDPFGAEPGGRLYKSGDLGRWGSDGELRFAGRRDHQVKVRGFRVEPGEIETVLDRHPAVGQTVVTAVSASGEVGNHRLAAYVTPADGGSIESLDVETLRAWVGSHLPGYMVPSAWVLLPELPQTPNGKVDRKALPEPALEETRVGGAAPASPLEELLAGIWREALGLEAPDAVGVEDRFFEDLGGHSLLATRVLSRVREHLRVDLSLGALFDAPTVRSLGRKIEEIRRGAARALPPIEPLPDDLQGADLPLSFAQERILFAQQLSPESPFYNLPLRFDLGAGVSGGAVTAAARELRRRHEALRTVFHAEGPRLRQRVQSPRVAAATAVPRVNLSGLAPADRHAALGRLSYDEGARLFDLAARPVVRFAQVHGLEGGGPVVLATLHHVSGDGWSTGVLAGDLARLAAAYTQGRPSPLDELPLGVPDFAVWQRSVLDGEVLEASLEHFEEALAGAPTVLDLPTDRPRPAEPSHRGGAWRLRLSPAVTDALKARATRAGVTPYMLLTAVYTLLLHRLSGQRDLLVGSPIANRRQRALEDVVGCFLNLVVLRSRLGAGESFDDHLAAVRTASLGAHTHQDLPFDKLVEHLRPAREAGRHPLFQVLFEILPAPRAEAGSGEESVKLVERSPGAARFDLEMSVREAGDHWITWLEYDLELFDRTTARRWLGHFRTLLEQVAEDPEAAVADFAWLAPAQRQQLLREWNDTEAELTPVPLHRHVLRQSERTPDAVALVAGERHVTYGELTRRAGFLARRLRALGVGPEVPVGLSGDRDAETMIAVLGILLSGGAYVPLDPAFPEARLTYMLEDAQRGVTPRVLLADEAALAARPSLRQASETVLEIGPALSAEDLPGAEADASEGADVPLEGLAYVIYTSGSTGRPKGVQVPHGAVARFLSAMRDRPGLDPSDALLAVTTLSFDISVLELFLPLSVGARVVVPAKQDTLAADRLQRVLEDERISVMQATPATWRLLVDSGWRGGFPRVALSGGEALSPELGRKLVAHTDATWNLYGPTEATVWAAAECLEAVEAADGEPASVPLGRPIRHLRAHVVDGLGQPVPPGVHGEIRLAGAALARGYRHRPAKTAEVFVPDPHGAPGSRVYRTGDLGRRLADGRLEFAGRLDHQVKVRGYRIELGEIEAVAERHDAVGEAVVVVFEEQAGDPRLVAYLTLAPGRDEPPAVADLRAFLGRDLPDYMVPSRFVSLEEMPRTPNGKVDRKALPAPSDALDAHRETVPPRNETEAGLVEIWSKVLRLEGVGIRDSFFDLGGHSLLAIHVVTHIRERFGVEVPLGTLFKAPTVEKMAAVVSGDSEAPSSHLIRLGGEDSGRAPLFCVHGVGGNVFRLAELARRADRPFYGLQGGPDVGDLAYMESVKSMAARYLEEIRREQPEGPYFLGGECLGAMLSYEMARQLLEAGEEVAFVGVLNTAHEDLRTRQSEGQKVQFEMFIANALEIPLDPSKLEGLDPRQRMGLVVESGIRAGALPPGFTAADAKGYIQVFQLQLRAMLQHRPEAADLFVHVFTAPEEGEAEGPWGWDHLARSGARRFDIPGEDSIMRAPRVDELARLLFEAVAAAEEAAAARS